MLSLWRNKSEQRRIGCKAATMVRKDFGFPQFAKRMAEIADQMI